MDSEQVVKLRERLLLCAVCMDEYKDPRLLPCHHTLCFECIENVIQSSSCTGRFFKCPQCRANVAVPIGGAQELPINFYIISLQDELGINGYTGTCNVCQQDWIPAQFRCVDCDIDICRCCIHAHRLEIHDEPPKILRIESGSSNIQTRLCPSHVDENCQLFCHTCSEAICVICSCSSHKRHKVVPLSVQLQVTTKYLQTELDVLMSEKRNALKVGNEVEMLKQEIINCHKQSAACLSLAAEEACRFITESAKALETVIKSSTKAQEDEIDGAMKDYRSYLWQIEKGVGFLQDLQTGDVCLEVMDAYKKFLVKLNAAKKNFTSKSFNLRVCDFASFNTTKVLRVNLLDKHFYHLGKLGTLSENKYSITFDHKTARPLKHPQGLTNLMKRRTPRVITRAFVIFILFQMILYLGSVTGVFDWLAVIVGVCCAQFSKLNEQ